MRSWLDVQIGSRILELPVRKKRLDSFAARLEKAGDAIQQTLKTVNASTPNHKKLRHIIGMERWGQQRLKVFLGEPFVRDEHDSYKPERTSTWQELIDDFATTRRETVALAQQLAIANVSDSAKVIHNQWGAVGAKAWLNYLANHARIEAKLFK